MGSGSKKKTTRTRSTYTPPSWIEDSAKNANALASQYANQKYERYTGDRVAGLSENEERGAYLAQQGVGAYQNDLNSARTGLQDVSTDFTSADMEGYMNPYIKAALDPTAREIRQGSQRRQEELAGSLMSRGAFSGRRAGLAAQDEREVTQQSISDLYSRGYSDAFDRGSALWQADQDRKLTQSRQFMDLAGLGSDLLGADYERLMDSGETQRFVEQTMKDFDYQQFIEERDWTGKQAAYLTDVLRGLKGSYTETQLTRTSSKEESGSKLGKIIGLIVSVVGAYFLAGSDRRLKTGIVHIGWLRSSGLRVYEYTIQHRRTIGVMADEVEKVFPDAVVTVPATGYQMVLYGKVGWSESNFELMTMMQEAA